MELIKVTFLALLICGLAIYAESKDESDDQLSKIDEENNEGELFVAADGGAASLSDADEEAHERVIRSPWGGRRRRRWGGVRLRSAARSVGRAVTRTVRKVGVAVKKVPKVIKETVRKIPRELKRVGSQVGRAVRRTVRKASSVVRKTVKEVKRAGRRIKTIPRKTGKALRKIKDKVKEKIGKLIKKKEEEEEEEEEVEEEEIITPETTSSPGEEGIATAATTQVTITNGCDVDCQTIKEFSQSADFFRQSHCAFYFAKRHHRDFFLDRNKNTTLDLWMGDISKEAAELYGAFAEGVKSVKKSFIVKNQQQLKEDCIKSGTQQCNMMTAQDVMEFYKLKCFKSCPGLTGCATQDKNLIKTINNAIGTHDKKLNQQATF